MDGIEGGDMRPEASPKNGQQFYQAFIFDLEGSLSNRSSDTSTGSVSDYPKQNATKRSGRSTNSSEMSEDRLRIATAAESPSQCCGCFGFAKKRNGKKTVAGVPDEDTYLLL